MFRLKALQGATRAVKGLVFQNRQRQKKSRGLQGVLRPDLLDRNLALPARHSELAIPYWKNQKEQPLDSPR